MGLRSGDRYRVLVVDESPEARRLIRSTLEGCEHFEVVGAVADGVAGVQLATDVAPDMIVFDPATDRGDGIAAIRELTAAVPDAGLVVYSNAGERDHAALEAGALACVHKRGPASELVDALNTVAALRSGRTDPRVLSDAQELRQLVFESMSEGVVVQDQAGRIVFTNAAAQRILDRTPDAMLGSTSMDPHWGVIHPDGSPWPGKEHPASEALRTHQPVRNALMGVQRGADGRCWLSVTATPMRSATGDPIGVVVTFVDVTEQREAELARLESEARFRSAVDSMLDAFMILRSVREDDRIVDFVYEFVNAAVETHAGYRPDELVGRRLLEVAPSLETSGAFGRYVDAVETGTAIVMEVPWSDGPRVQGAFEVRGVPVGDGLALTFRNITARKRAEASVTQDRRGARDAEQVSGWASVDAPTLTARELEVLALLGRGASTREISERLFISVNTSRNHAQRTIAKLGAHSRLEAVAIARRSGLLPGDPRLG